jgi:hypothetical protein
MGKKKPDITKGVDFEEAVKKLLGTPPHKKKTVKKKKKK